MIPGLLGKKIGMTQVFDGDGNRVPVTVLEVGPCLVQAVKSNEKDGYTAVQLGYDDTKEKRVKKPQREYLKANKLDPKKFVKEIRCEGAPEVKVGDKLTNRIFQKGDYLDVVGTSKGKGFQGGMKRWNWSGGGETHGSMSHRAPGSIGQSSYPSRVFKGMHMAGHMGDDRITVQNLEVIEVDAENNTVMVRGAVPGSNGSYIIVKYAKKKPVAERIQPEVVEEEVAEEETSDDRPQTTDGEVAAAEETKEQASPEKEEEDKEGSKE
jgi:large subunit ribosomal protein L3